MATGHRGARSDVRREIGIGVIGLGWMGRVHTAAYKRVPDHFPELGVRPRLLLAADVSPQRRAQAEAMGFEGSAEDWRAVVEHPGIDAVSITLSNAGHREVAVAAVEAGKHVSRRTTSSKSTTRTGRGRCFSSRAARSGRSRRAASSSVPACACASRSTGPEARWPGSSSG